MKIVIVGGGIAGCSAAFELANKGHQVSILETKAELLSGSSDNTPCRLGLGFHYPDKVTAIKYLKSTLAFIKKHGTQFIVANSEDNSHPLRRGRYFIVNNSTIRSSQVLETYEAIKAEYTRLVKEDPTNGVFGDPENFFRELTINKYSNDVNLSEVKMGIETAEQILDWQKYKKFLIEKLKEHPNISIQTSTHVHAIEHSSSSSGFIVKANNVNYEADSVINASWYNIERLNAQAGYLNTPRTNRIKVIIEVELPKELHNANSMFFCFGPYCAFNNTGNGKGFISYEPTTNIGQSSEIILPKELQNFLDGNITENEKNIFAKKIIAGVSTYIPKIGEAQFKGVMKFGNVKTYGEVANLTNANCSSGINQRRESGVEQQQVLWFSDSAMKLLFGGPNAEELIQALEKHSEINEEINKISNEIFPLENMEYTESEKILNNKVLNHALIKTMQRYWTLPVGEEDADKNFFDVNKLRKIVDVKQTVTQKISQKKSQGTVGFFKSSLNSLSESDKIALPSPGKAF